MGLKQPIKKQIELARIKIQKLVGYTYKKQRRKPIIFVLSTGRCGSTSIKKIFEQHPKFLAFHEEIKPLIRLSTELAENPENKVDVYKELDAIFKNRLWEAKKDQIIVHSDHRLWNLVPYLSIYFTNAFFIHLIRNPVDSVRSYLQRDWYKVDVAVSKKNLFHTYRLYGDKVNDMSRDEWDNSTQIEKCLWYWNFVNATIHKDLNTLNKTRHEVIRLESLMDDINSVIRRRYDLEPDFRFINVTVNESKQKINLPTLTSEIHRSINKNSKRLFLYYYPNLNSVKNAQ